MNLSPTQILILAIVAPPALAVYIALLWSSRHDFTSGSRDADDAGSTLTGCHLDDRDEMVTTRFVTSEEINRRVENMRPPLYDDRAMRN